MLRSSSLTIPFSGGMQQKGDHRLQQPPALDKCVDAEFDDVGGLRTRKPYGALGVNILGGGTLSNVRRIVDNGGELLCFTQTGLYSWDANNTAWVSRGTYMAAKVDEATVFSQNDDQHDCDRADLSGVTYYTWVTSGGTVYVASMATFTGVPISVPVALTTGTRPRLVALQTKVLITFLDGSGNLVAAALAPSQPATSQIQTQVSGFTTVLSSASGMNVLYDIEHIPSTDSALFVTRRTVTTSYTIGTITAAVAVSSTTKARTCDGAIAVAVTTDGLSCEVVRANGANIQGDYITIASFVDVSVGQALGTTSASSPQQIAVAFSSTATTTCTVFWDDADTPLTGQFNTGGSGGAGSASALPRYLRPASRAFDYGGSVYCWFVFSETNETGILPSFTSTLQNTFFLYKAVGSTMQMVAKACPAIAGGPVAAQAHLPNVVNVASGQYAFAANIRRIINVGPSSTGSAQRAPHAVTVTFDTNEARRCIRLGGTFYIANGEGLSQYDGQQIVDVGYPISPWSMAAGDGGAGGNLSAGTYAVKATWRRENAAGEIERSTTTNVGTFTATAAHQMTALGVASLSVGHKTTSSAVEIWRTVVNPTADSPFYLVTNKDPAVTSNPNRYLANDPTLASCPQLNDTLSDATLATKENNPENGSVLENLAPPACTIITADASRLYLAGIAGAPNVVWYSKTRAEGEIAAFNDGLTVQLPATGGDITALAFLNETLIVFKETAIYALPGDGYDNTGGGNNFGPARLLSTDVGATSAESVGITDMGLVFKSDRGWYLLDKGWQVQYIGAPVVDSDTETPLAVNVVTGQHQVRILTANRLLVWDTLVNQWGEWSIASGATACLWNGVHLYATSSAVYQQRSDFTGVTYGMDVETAWIKPADPVGQCRIQWLMPLGEYRSTCALRIRIGRNYRQDGAGNWEYFDDKYRAPATVVGGPLQVRIGPSIPGMEAVKVRLTAVNAVNDPSPPTGEAIKLSALGVEFGVQPGLFKRLASAQKA